FGQLYLFARGQTCLHAADAAGSRFWFPLVEQTEREIRQALMAIQHHIGKPVAVFPHGPLVGLLRSFSSSPSIRMCPQAYRALLPLGLTIDGTNKPVLPPSPHLKRLEAESIHILR